MSHPFFKTLNYAAVHEDSQSELTALKLGSSDRVVCITGSGARPLELLLGDPMEVIAIDLNPAQIALLELKIAAMRQLSHAEFLAFIGVLPAVNRLATYINLQPILTPSARQYWDAKQSKISDGVIYSGEWERRLRFFARLFSLVFSSKRDRLFACQTVSEQHVYWRNHWDNYLWRLFLKVIFNRTLWYWFGNEPGASLVPREMDVPAYMHGRLESAASGFLFNHSPWAWLVFYGRYDPNVALPLYLQPENYDLISNRLDRIRVVESALTDYLNSVVPGSIDAYSLSDVASYMTEQAHQQCWAAIFHSAAAGAHVCERRFLVRYPTTHAESLGLLRNKVLETSLTQSDQSVVYDFVCGAIGGGMT